MKKTKKNNDVGSSENKMTLISDKEEQLKG